MSKITRFPFFGKHFFVKSASSLVVASMEHLWRLVVAIAAMQGHRPRVGDLLPALLARLLPRRFEFVPFWQIAVVLVYARGVLNLAAASYRLPPTFRYREQLLTRPSHLDVVDKNWRTAHGALLPTYTARFL